MIRMNINAYGDVTLAQSARPIGQVRQNDAGLWQAVYEDEFVRGPSGFIPAFPAATDAAMEVWNAFMRKAPVAVAA